MAGALKKHKNRPLIKPVKKESENESIWLVSYADMVTLLMGFFALLLSFSKIDARKYEEFKMKTTELFGGEYVVPYQQLGGELKKILESQNLNDKVLVEQKLTGVEITFQGALFFESGSVELNKGAIQLLDRLVPIIKESAANFFITIEGHTDDSPLKNNGLLASNWELSSIRACNVLRIFEGHGFSSTHLKAIGWGSIKPKIQNKDETSRAINRRVVIKILKDSNGTDS